ncbi:glycosyltransferase [Roseovarius sp. 2305UL8-3]|uniref:glycosyltransferase n=1 Tax=Roseovarius conchicola TaxID=3121636 RepID=UPI003529503D
MSRISRRKTVLFLSGPALGHVSRLSSIARRIRETSDARIHFVLPGVASHHDILQKSGFEFSTVNIPKEARDLPAVAFADGLETLFRDLSPDAIVHDMCPLRWLSVTRFPDCQRFHVTNFFLTRAHDAETSQKTWYDEIGGRVSEIRASRGLCPLKSVFDLYDADAVLLADPPALCRRPDLLPSSYELCGPIFEQSEGDQPDALLNEENILLLSMGSTGRDLPDNELISSLKEWSGSSASVYAGTEAEAAQSKGLADHYHGWLPLKAILAKSRFCVTQGGAGSTYMALAAGVPVGVVPTDPNHRILGELIEQAGLGLCSVDNDTDDKIASADYATLAENARAFASEPTEGSRVIAQRISEMIQ